jgi:hypothetical protein
MGDFYYVRDRLGNESNIGMFTSEINILKGIYNYLQLNYQYAIDNNENETWDRYYGKRADFIIMKIEEGVINEDIIEDDSNIISSKEYIDYMENGPRESSIKVLLEDEL